MAENKRSPYSGSLKAATDHYHGVKSCDEYGEIAHAAKLASIYRRIGLAHNDRDAVALANMTIQKLDMDDQGLSINKMARDELRVEHGAESTSIEPQLPFAKAGSQ